MNIHTPDITAIPERKEAEAALELLRRWSTFCECHRLCLILIRRFRGLCRDQMIVWTIPPFAARAIHDGFEVDDAPIKRRCPTSKMAPQA